MQNQFHLSLSQVADIVKANAFDCPFSPFIEVQMLVVWNGYHYTAELKAETEMVEAVLRAYAEYEVHSIVVRDASHDTDILKIGFISENHMHGFPKLFTVETLRWKQFSESCVHENDADMDDDGPEYPSTVKTLGDLLREKFGDPV